MKRIISILLTVSIFLTLFTGICSASDTFTDVAEDAWSKEAVEEICSLGFMKGYPDGTFRPKGTVSRAQFVTVLYRMAGEPAQKSKMIVLFRDVQSNDWFAKAVVWAQENQIVQGVGNDCFNPSGAITREQMATILEKYYRYSHPGEKSAWQLDAEEEAKYQDWGEVSNYAADGISYVLYNGIMNGIAKQDGLYLAPKQTATREQLAAMLVRYLDTQKLHLQSENLMEGLEANPVDASLTEKSANAIASCSLELFRRTHSENTVLSPLSILYCLDLVANGAKGNTKAQLENAFGISVSELNEALCAISDSTLNQYVKLKINNSLWIHDGFSVATDYLQTCKDYLDASVFRAPFNTQTVQDMNDWISYNTDDMIPKLIDELDPDTALAAINTILFKGKWAEGYTVTEKAPFYGTHGTQTVDMLSSEENIYLSDDNATGFMKFFAGGRYAFAVVMPNEDVALADYLKGLTGEGLRRLLKGEVYDAVYAKMPAFSSQTLVSMPSVLKQMGITDAFEPGVADFSGISEHLFVSEVLHKSVIAVNEKGVSAAGATLITEEITSAVQDRIKTVTVDRPYLYMIIDTRWNLPLFIGTTENLI